MPKLRLLVPRRVPPLTVEESQPRPYPGHLHCVAGRLAVKAQQTVEVLNQPAEIAFLDDPGQGDLTVAAVRHVVYGPGSASVCG